MKRSYASAATSKLTCAHLGREGVDALANLFEVDLGRRGAAGDPDAGLALEPSRVLGGELVGIGDVDGRRQDLGCT